MTPIPYHTISKELEARGIKDRDMFGRRDWFQRWCDKKGYRGLDAEGKPRNASRLWMAEYREDHNGERLEAPYCNLWHWFLFTFEDYPVDRWTYTDRCRYLDCEVVWSEIEPVWVRHALMDICDRHNGRITVRLEV